MDFFGNGETSALIVSIIKIILVDILLAGDNSVVIGMVASKLSADLQRKAILWGTAGAIIMRLVFAFVLVEALHRIPGLHLVGGLLLVWIAVQLLSDSEQEEKAESKDSLKSAIITIIIADMSMSIDNVLGVVGAADGNINLVIMGMLISVPIIIFSSSLIAKYIQKYPIILYIGAAILAWVAADMIMKDSIISSYVVGYELLLKVLCIIFVIGISKIR